MMLFARALSCALCLVLSGTCVSAQTTDPCATAPQTCATLISTHATAEKRLPSTAVDISVKITSTDKDLPTVERQLSRRSNELLDWLRSQSVQRLSTDDVAFSPETRSPKSGADKTVGYDGSLAISFRTTPEKAADVLAGVLIHGANDIEGVAFTPTEEEIANARRELSAQATQAAIAQGEAVAKAAGLHLASVRRIDMEGGGNNFPMESNGLMPMAGVMAEKRVFAPTISTAAGDRTLSMRVDVVLAAVR